MKRRNFAWILYQTILWGFALSGAFLIFSYIAIQLNLTRDPGQADPNARFFSQMRDRYNQGFRQSADSAGINNFEIYERLILLNRQYPLNARQVESAIRQGLPQADISRMLDEIDLSLTSDSLQAMPVNQLSDFLQKNESRHGQSVFSWMNIAEWQDFRVAVAKDKVLIDSAAKECGLESRLIVACLVGEQIRLFNSSREAYKRWIGPLKILSVESQFSFGVTGIKEQTAISIEKNLADSLSVFYPGRRYAHLLDFQTADIAKERISRLTSYRDHYYSYLYAGLFLRQVMTQWERAGYSIQRPEILATLFNIGFANSKPKTMPEVGGALIKIKEMEYTFGAIASQFYYSGDLMDLFPYREKKFL